ncbi:MAG: 3-oxoacyl-[acyl-carrier protein] reductase [Gaiellaceae bacterium]|jgi:3-oxoacyl-[acyl-carrier protein] reductase|nr:3-oxoacyl-[acyl-carrier protein] reductase [Gaiellaceae bacterium]
MDLAGKSALVTGVSRRAGIGFAIARRLGEAGAGVFAQGWTPHDVAQEYADAGRADGVVQELGVGYVEADFADPDAPRRVVDAACAHFGGPLDLLVVNHARSGGGQLADTSAATLDAFFAENVRASLLLVKEFAAQFEGDSGSVVLMTSGIHKEPMTSEIEYAVSKGALHIATATLADDLADRGIRVNCVNPGPTDTGWGIAELDPSRSMPAGRWGEPDDASRLVAWLCSDDARWVTGQTIDSEGGFRRST